MMGKGLVEAKGREEVMGGVRERGMEDGGGEGKGKGKGKWGRGSGMGGEVKGTGRMEAGAGGR